MKAILLAAGKGERFYPFSHFRPKAMFPICNRPLLEWSVERLVAAGVTDIGVVIGHRGGRVRNHFGDGNRFGCEITYIEQREQLGGFLARPPVLVICVLPLFLLNKIFS